MRGRRVKFLLLGIGVLPAAMALAGAGALPPPADQPLSAILRVVEGKGLGVITSVEMDDWSWEVKVCEGRRCLKLYIDPTSSEEQRRRRTDSDRVSLPADAKPLSSIIESLESQNLGVITEVELEHGYWKVSLRNEGRKVKLSVNPRTGETRELRRDRD